MPFRSWAGACGGGCYVPIGPGEPVGKSRGSRTGVDMARRRVGYRDGRGVRRGDWGGGWWSAHLPSFLRTPCLRVSFSQCRKPTYLDLFPSLSLPLFLSLYRSFSFLSFFLTLLPHAPLRRGGVLLLPLLSVSLFALFSASAAAPLLWIPKLFGHVRRLLISWPRLSSSGLILTRCYSSRRIHRIRIARDVTNTFSQGSE